MHGGLVSIDKCTVRNMNGVFGNIDICTVRNMHAWWVSKYVYSKNQAWWVSKISICVK